jgi:Na+/phosphate symporter
MADDSTDKIDIATERSRIRHAFWLSILGLALAAILTVFLVWFTKVEFEKSAEVVAIVGLFTSVTGTLVGAFFGQQIGAAGAEHERRNRQEAEESRQRAEDVARMALAHLDRDTAKEVLRASQKQP